MTIMTIDAFIAEQPRVVAATLAAIPRQIASWRPAFAEPAFTEIVRVGAGSSFNALAAVEPMLTAALRAGLPTLVLTADAGGPITATGATLAVLPLGPEPIGPKTKGFTASLAGLFAVAAPLAARPLPRWDAEAALTALLEPSRRAAQALAATLDGCDQVLVAGEGRHLGITLEASLKIAEIAGVPAAAFDTEEVLHGRLHGLTDRGIALLIAADAEQREVAERAAAAMAALGAVVRVLDLTASAPTPSGWPAAWPAPPAPFDAIAAVLPFQQLACALAMRRGRDPSAMRYPGLSQRLAIKLDAQP